MKIEPGKSFGSFSVRLFDILQQMNFKTSKADPGIWMRSSKYGTHYVYIAVYVDDLAICMKDP